MRLRTVAALSLAGMICSSATVYSLTPPARPDVAAVPEALALPGAPAPAPLEIASSFDAGTTLRVGGRVGHPRLLRRSSGETFMLLEVRAPEDAGAPRSGSSHLAIVIDRSGSMKGDRIQNAIAGAVEAVDRLGDGDMVSVVAFDTTATDVVHRTVLGPGTREQVKASIRGIRLGGDTCISCGLEEGLRELSSQTGRVDRMILLSDGEATAGVRDLPGFRAIAERARAQGVSVTTIGVGVDYNQRVLGGIALQAGGQHYFIENTAALARVFQAEADQLRATVARDVTASVDLADGVELLSVADRTFERRGRRVVVPLGSFARKEDKTVLLRVRVPTGVEGRVPVADVSLDYADLVAGRPGRCDGRLEVGVGADQAEIDSVVGERVERDRTAAALLEANDLLERGRVDDARRRIATRQAEVAATAAVAASAAPAGRAGDVKRDFASQSSSLSTAAAAAAAPKPAARAPRVNQEMANPFFR
jgi:Ca-activated chloride channel family protein